MVSLESGVRYFFWNEIQQWRANCHWPVLDFLSLVSISSPRWMEATPNPQERSFSAKVNPAAFVKLVVSSLGRIFLINIYFRNKIIGWIRLFPFYLTKSMGRNGVGFEYTLDKAWKTFVRKGTCQQRLGPFWIHIKLATSLVAQSRANLSTDFWVSSNFVWKSSCHLSQLEAGGCPYRQYNVAMQYSMEAIKSVSWPNLYLKVVIFYHTFTFNWQFSSCKVCLTFVCNFSSDLKSYISLFSLLIC